MSDRKRSCWGGSNQSGGPPRNEAAAASTCISNQDAISALLSSAQSRQKERDDMPKKQRRSDDRDKRGPRKNDNNKNAQNDSYYGPPPRDKSNAGSNVDTSKADYPEDDEPVDKQKPNFGLSGALSKDAEKGNVYKGVQLKFSEPPEARAPLTQWRLYVFKGEETLETLHIAKQSAYLLGRNEDIADIPLRHGSCSSQHAVLQYRALPNAQTGKLQCSPYLLDLESTNGCFINGARLESARYYQLKKGDVMKFGASTREYVLLTANTTSLDT